ncbi:hypothetical protein OH77DRAFT_1249915 [Trametes cingulata]|nr:hypothetical protein OH77DRAFT_1249915 [Trametes cingulata]
MSIPFHYDEEEENDDHQQELALAEDDDDDDDDDVEEPVTEDNWRLVGIDRNGFYPWDWEHEPDSEEEEWEDEDEDEDGEQGQREELAETTDIEVHAGQAEEEAPPNLGAPVVRSTTWCTYSPLTCAQQQGVPQLYEHAWAQPAPEVPWHHLLAPPDYHDVGDFAEVQEESWRMIEMERQYAWQDIYDPELTFDIGDLAPDGEQGQDLSTDYE